MRNWLMIAAAALFAGSVMTHAAASRSPASRPAQTGHFRITFTERSPLSKLDEVLRRIGATEWTVKQVRENPADYGYNLAEEPFDIFVPSAYKPTVPCGLLVWMGVPPLPREWDSVFSRHKLICVSADLQQRRKRFVRVQLPLDAVHNLKKLYNIDDNRVYIAGFSAGAGASAYDLCAYPDVFRGGYFLMGARFYQTRRDAKGAWETTSIRMLPPWNGADDQSRRNTPLVLMRSQKDPLYGPEEDRGQVDRLRRDGFTHVTFIEVPGIGHVLPSKAWFEKGLIALEPARKEPR